MAARFPEAVLAQIKGRELMAEALDAQQRDYARRSLIYKLAFISLPLLGAAYGLYGGKIPASKFLGKIPALKKMMEEKNILAKASEQLKKENSKAPSSSKSSAQAGYTSMEGTDQEIQALEKRDPAMRNFVAKTPHKKLSEKEVMQMAERAESAQSANPAALSQNSKDHTNALESAAGETSGNNSSAEGGGELEDGASPVKRNLASVNMSVQLEDPSTHPDYQMLSPTDPRVPAEPLKGMTPSGGAYRSVANSDPEFLSLQEPTKVISSGSYETKEQLAYP